MSSIVAVAGGSAGLGRAIVEQLVADGRYQVIILSRSVRNDPRVPLLSIQYF